MNPPSDLMRTRSIGYALLAAVVLFMIGAFSAAYFRRMPSTDRLERLTMIANDPVDWSA